MLYRTKIFLRLWQLSIALYLFNMLLYSPDSFGQYCLYTAGIFAVMTWVFLFLAVKRGQADYLNVNEHEFPNEVVFGNYKKRSIGIQLSTLTFVLIISPVFVFMRLKHILITVPENPILAPLVFLLFLLCCWLVVANVNITKRMLKLFLQVFIIFILIILLLLLISFVN